MVVSAETRQAINEMVNIEEIIASANTKGLEVVSEELKQYIPKFSRYIKDSLNQYSNHKVLRYLHYELLKMLFGESNKFHNGGDFEEIQYYLKDDTEYINTLAASNQLEPDHLELAAAAGAVNMFKMILANNVEASQNTLLSAIAGGNEEIIQLIIEKGIQIDNKMFFNQVIQEAYNSCRPKIAQWLIEQFDHDHKEKPNGYFTSIHQFLAAFENNHEPCNFEKYQIQQLANTFGVYGLKFLVENGNFSYTGQDDIFELVLFQGNVECSRYMKTLGFTIKNPINFAMRALLESNSDNLLEIIEFLQQEFGLKLDDCDPTTGKTLLHVAAKHSNESFVDMLLSNKVDVNKADNKGRTPLMEVAGTNIKIVVKLVEAGADIHAKNDIDETALFYAAADGNKQVIEYLLSKRAKANLTSKLNHTPFSLCNFVNPDAASIIQEYASKEQ